MFILEQEYMNEVCNDIYIVQEVFCAFQVMSDLLTQLRSVLFGLH